MGLKFIFDYAKYLANMPKKLKTIVDDGDDLTYLQLSKIVCDELSEIVKNSEHS